MNDSGYYAHGVILNSHLSKLTDADLLAEVAKRNLDVTHAYALLPISEAAYEEIRRKMEVAGYADQFIPNPNSPASPRLDMHGIALVPEVEMIEGRDQDNIQ